MKVSTEIYSAARHIGEERAIELYARAGFDCYDLSMFEMARIDWSNMTVIDTKHPFAKSDYASFAKNYEIAFEIGDPFNEGETLLFTETLYVGQEVTVSDIIANNATLGENAEEIAAYYENSLPLGENVSGGFSFSTNKILKTILRF